MRTRPAGSAGLAGTRLPHPGLEGTLLVEPLALLGFQKEFHSSPLSF